MARNFQPLTLLALLLSPVLSLAGGPDRKGVEFFEKKIRPVLAEHCYQCHSAEAEKAKKLRGGLRLDSREGLFRGGDSGPALVPGKAKDSHLLQALRYAGDVKMPPKGRLPETVIADFVKWVEMGAPDPREGSSAPAKLAAIDLEKARQFWAFRPLAAPVLPATKNTRWAQTPIDRFILAGLEARGLTPSPLVGREKLIRRAYYDLWGLPPTPAEIDAFLKDTAPDAYERLLDRLLAGEHYGERWGRHWLDVVRFAESGGYEFDGDRPGAYHYRDWVIKALNQDMPYDEFVRRQLAGDHLFPQDYLATSATGFLVAGPFPGQLTAKTQALIRYNHLDDMVSTLGSAMLALTVGCARCHDHKFDPVPQQDYYRLIANLARTDSANLNLDPEPAATRKAKAAFDQAHAPFLAVRDRFAKEQLPGRLRTWYRENKDKPAAQWSILDVDVKAKTPFKKLDDGSLLATGKVERLDTYTLVAHTNQRGITALRLEALADSSLPRSGPGRGPAGDFLLSGVTLTAAPLQGKGKPAPVKLRAVQATFEQAGFPLKATLDNDKKTGWSIGGQAGKGHAAIFEVDGALGFEGGTVLTLTLKFESNGFPLGRPRLALTTAPRPAKLDGTADRQARQELLAALAASQGQLTAKNRDAVDRWFRKVDPGTEKVFAAVDQHARQEPQPKLLTVFAAASGKGGDVSYLIRGEVERKNGVARPGFLQVLTTGAEQERRWLGEPLTKQPAVEPRVALARWLTDSERGAGHLLARVIVNRLWQHHLGRGLVATPNDFGTQGERPTHPELLDWLAGELIRNGWRLKPIHKLILTSAVYRQSGETNPAALRADPQNHLWWRRPTRRLEAEAIRDALLGVSDTLDRTMYGPGPLDGNSARRSVYLKVKRSQLIPLLQMFDAPEAIQSVGERSTTTVATQSLAFLNSPFVRQRAEKFAQRIRPKSAETMPEAIEAAYLTALTRRPSAGERDRMAAFVLRQAESYGSSGRALDLALTDFCQVLLCLNEFVYVD